MEKSLLITSSTDGQTVKIMEHIIKIATLSNYDFMDVKDALNQDIKWEEYDQILIGASVRYGHFSKDLYRFIEKNHKQLNEYSACFFGVNLTARKEEKNQFETNSYTKKFAKKIQWQPKEKAVFAGAVRWSLYNFWQTKIIQLIMFITKGPKDTSQDIEFTDWEKVEEFAQLFKN